MGLERVLRDGAKGGGSMNNLARRLATDGRFIVEEIEGRSFWPGQPFIADCGISASHRLPEATKAYAEELVRRWNAHDVSKGKPTEPERNPHFDAVADLRRKCADLIRIVEGSKHQNWVAFGANGPGMRLRDMPEWCAFYVSVQRD